MIKKLNDICSFVSGNAWKSSKFANEGIPIIRINNLNNNDNNFKYWQGDYDKKYLIYKGDLLVSLSGTIKTFQWNGPEALLNQRIVKVTANQDTNQDWVYYQISHVIEQIADKGKHAVIKNVSINDLKNFEVDVPDFQTQNKIVAILDKGSALVQKRQRTIDLLDKLLRDQFHFLFGEPYQNSLGWPEKQLGKITLNIKSGWSIGGEQRQKQENELGVLKVSAVTSGYFKPEEHKAVTKDEITRELVTPKKGDLLFSRANTIDLVGATCIVDKDYDDLFLPDKLWRIDLDENVATREYVKGVLSSTIYRKNFVRTATGSSGSMLNISQSKFNSAKIPIPPIEFQRKYVNLFWNIQQQKEKLKSSLSEISSLLSALLQRAFSGNLKFDVVTELDALLIEIDIQKSENDLFSIITNEEYLLSLVNRLNNQEFESQVLYDKAKHAAFQLLKEEERLAQKYDERSKSIKLVVK